MRDLDRPMPIQPNSYLARMARFTDGPEHDLRRAEVLRALPAVEGLEEAAFSRASVGLPDLVDAAPIARTVPVAVLGDALGVGDLTEKIGALCDHGTVCDGLPSLAFTSVLFQCRDATAALALMALGDDVHVEDAVPVVRTRRAPDRWVSLAETPYGAGPHACPGREHALALARGVVRAFAGYDVVERGADEQRPNLRMASRLIMQRR